MYSGGVNASPGTTTAQLVYGEEELLREHVYAAPHVVAGYRLHGGFGADGRYLSPRSALRPAAVRAWQRALAARGWKLIPADPSLLVAGSYPTFEQMKLLLESGLAQNLWNSLTITGIIEARGRLLCEVPVPDFQRIAEEDVGPMALGHLHKGLLRAHGLDEGGDPVRQLGGHDAMWFAIRDLVLGKDRYPIPEVPARIGRPDADERLAPELPADCERMILLLMNVLMIEVRAETTFSLTEQLLSDPELFADNRAGADAAIEMVKRIRQDEEIHVEYLRTVLSELGSLTFRTRPGDLRTGQEIIDPIWKVLVHWHTIENPKLARAQQREIVRARILAHAEGERILAAHLALEPPDPWDA